MKEEVLNEEPDLGSDVDLSGPPEDNEPPVLLPDYLKSEIESVEPGLSKTTTSYLNKKKFQISTTETGSIILKKTLEHEQITIRIPVIPHEDEDRADLYPHDFGDKKENEDENEENENDNHIHQVVFVNVEKEGSTLHFVVLLRDWREAHLNEIKITTPTGEICEWNGNFIPIGGTHIFWKFLEERGFSRENFPPIVDDLVNWHLDGQYLNWSKSFKSILD